MFGTIHLKWIELVSHPVVLKCDLRRGCVFDEFLRVYGLERMVRRHSVVEEGFKWWFGGRLLSLYSAKGVWDEEFLGLVLWVVM